MKFESPSFIDLYNKLKDNKKLEKYLIKLGALVTSEDFYDEYGYKNKSVDLKQYIKDANDKVYRNLATIFEGKEDYINSKTIAYLIDTQFLREEIINALGFESDIVLPAKAYREIFYTYKYCYTQSFFQNNWENFTPLIDFEELTNNESATAFLDAVMKEFDKIDYIISHSTDWVDYSKIPFDYINYLTQLLGLEVKTFYMKSESEGKYRELAANIIDVYKGRGTIATFELLFNFLGFNLDLREYYFDRRRYFSISAENLEMVTNDFESYKYYLTTIEPCNNYLAEVATNETVTLRDYGKTHNLMNFDELVKKYGLKCVLGYDDTYINELGNLQEYDQDVYTYFKTNYVRLRPTKKFEGGNFSQNQFYQIAALMDFMTPEFLQREVYVVIDTGEAEEKMVINWTRDIENDDFYILDSEEFKNNFANKYIIDFEAYQNSEFMTEPYRITDKGEKVRYYNSLGMNSHVANNKYNNVFFNPLSEKIKIINTTRYWGNNRTDNEVSTDALYPIWRSDRNYTDDIKYTISNLKNSGNPLYFPRDLLKVPSANKDRIKYQKMPVYNLNGYTNKTLRKIIADGTNNIKEIKWVTSLPIELFLMDKDIPETKNIYISNNYENNYDKALENYLSIKNYKNYNNLTSKQKASLRNEIQETLKSDSKIYNSGKDIFAKAWKEVDNYSLVCLAAYNNYEELIKFVHSHEGQVINYDYLKDEFMGGFSIDWLIYQEEVIGNKVYNFIQVSNLSKMEATRDNYINDSKIKNILSTMLSENSYLIGYNNGTYFVYKYACVRTNNNINYNILKFTPSLKAKRKGGSDYLTNTYKDILDKLTYDNNGNVTFYNDQTLKTIDLNKNYNYVIYVSKDQAYYSVSYVPTKRKSVIHLQNRQQPSIKYIDIDNEKNSSSNTIGNYYYYDASVNDEILGTDYYTEKQNQAEETLKYSSVLADARTSRMYKYKYINIHKGDLIFSIYDNKVYEILGNGLFEQSEAKMSEFTDNGIKGGIASKNNIYGLKEINFYGRLEKEEKNGKIKYKIHEYDEEYKGFSEQDDDDNYILNNYNRNIEWSNLNIKFNSIKRPVREKVNSYFEELNNEVKIGERVSREKNELTFNIFKEICSGAEKDFNRKDLITWRDK